MLPAGQIHRPQPVTAGLQEWRDQALIVGRQQLLNGDVRRHLWAGHAKIRGIHGAYSRIGSEGQFDGMVKIDVKVDIAGLAVGLGVQAG